LLINIFFLCNFLKEYLKELSERAKKAARPSVLSTLMQAKYVIELTIISLYFSRYSLKVFYSLKINDIESLTSFINEEYSGGGYYTKQNYNEFFSLKAFYTIDKLYDILLFFISYVRFITYFIFNPKIKDFMNFIFDALTRIAYFMVFYVIVIIFLCVFSNNLFGLRTEAFKDFISSFFYILLFCNGHNHLISKHNNYFGFWEMIFIFMIFIIIVFFLNSVFIGIYLEAFRLVSWKTGYVKQKKSVKGFLEQIGLLHAKNIKNNMIRGKVDIQEDMDKIQKNIEMHEIKAEIV